MSLYGQDLIGPREIIILGDYIMCECLLRVQYSIGLSFTSAAAELASQPVVPLINLASSKQPHYKKMVSLTRLIVVFVETRGKVQHRTK